MRHLRRHYFDNYLSDHANDQYVAVIDHGRDANTNAPRYNVVVGTMTTLQELLTAARLLLHAPCFFKLPVGTSAIVDIYVPDNPKSDEPKTFDYQVFKAKLPSTVSESRAKQSGELDEKLSQLLSEAKGEAGGSASPKGTKAGATGPLGATGATGAACYLASSGPSGPMNPCGGQTATACDDPVSTVASCVNGVLQCIQPRLTHTKPDRSQSAE